MNKVIDTFRLFEKLCKNALLTNVNIILFLNKVDVLKVKLQNGHEINRYIINYDGMVLLLES